MTPASPSINGITIPLAWHLSPAHVRHLCGSAATVRLADRHAPLSAPRVSQFARNPAEILPGVAFEAPELRAPLAPIVESAIRQDARDRVLVAIEATASTVGLGATVWEIHLATGLQIRRIREVLDGLMAEGKVARSAGAAIPEEHRERTAHAYLWSLVAACEDCGGPLPYGGVATPLCDDCLDKPPLEANV